MKGWLGGDMGTWSEGGKDNRRLTSEGRGEGEKYMQSDLDTTRLYTTQTSDTIYAIFFLKIWHPQLFLPISK